MYISKSFIPILKNNPSEAKIKSHQLMLRVGMIKQSSAGIYSWLPLGFKVMKKILIILSFLHLLIGSEIKEKTLQVINDYYNQDIEIQESKFKIPKKVKKQIQNQIKQKLIKIRKNFIV